MLLGLLALMKAAIRRWRETKADGREVEDVDKKEEEEEEAEGSELGRLWTSAKQ